MLHKWIVGLTQNTAATASNASDPELRPLKLDGDKAEVIETIRRWTAKSPLWNLEEVVDSSEPSPSQHPRTTEPESSDMPGHPDARIRLIRRSRLFRFPDDVEVSVHSLTGEQRVVLWMTSASRVGKGDLGQNARNLKTLRRAILAEHQAVDMDQP